MWMISKNGKKSKPISESMVHELISSGKITGQDLAQEEGTSDWTPLEDCPEFAAHFLSEKEAVIPPPVTSNKSSSWEEEAPPIIPVPESKAKPKSPKANQPFQAKKPATDIIFTITQVLWSLSLLGFLFFWFVFDASVKTSDGGRIMNMGQMAVQSNGMMGFAVLLIIISLYMMVYKTSEILNRIEKSLSEKKRNEA